MSAGLLSMASGCHQYLVGTPYVLQREDARVVFANCPADCQVPHAPILYATDRARVDDQKQEPVYGYERANSLAFGVASVKLNPNPTWMELIEDSTRLKRERDYELALADVKEKGCITSTVSAGPGSAVVTAGAVDERNQFLELLQSRLAQSPRKDVYIFVHGFNNTFADAVFRIAEVWHFMGRVGVPIAYTWPAGLGGIRGYAYDCESGEFTVSHLREFIRTVAACPGVQRVHIIGHSRGTDVVVSALRELHLGYMAQGKSTQQELKLENLVLAAPDIDEEVFRQRCVEEKLFESARRTTIYASDFDRAIELSDWLFASRQRLGSLGVKDVSAKFRQSLAKMPNVQFIECKIAPHWTINHGYVFTNPAALSDLILVLRDSRAPGAEFGRPLRQPAEGVWELTDDYLAGKK